MLCHSIRVLVYNILHFQDVCMVVCVRVCVRVCVCVRGLWTIKVYLKKYRYYILYYLMALPGLVVYFHSIVHFSMNALQLRVASIDFTPL